MKRKHFRKDNHIAMAAKRGLFQVQYVTYDDKGVADIEPLTGWLPIEHARIEMTRFAMDLPQCTS